MSKKIASLTAEKRHIAEKANTLPKPHQIAYSLSCCERLYPYYVVFSQLSIDSKGNAVRLREMIDELWSVLESAKINHDRFHEFESVLEEFARDLDSEAGILFARVALYTLSAVQRTSQVAQNESGGGIEDMVEYSTSSIDSYLYEVTWPWIDYPTQAEYREFRDWLLDSQMLNMELKKQNTDLSLLKSQERLTSSFIDEFRAKTTTVNLFPIGREIFDR